MRRRVPSPRATQTWAFLRLMINRAAQLYISPIKSIEIDAPPATSSIALLFYLAISLQRVTYQVSIAENVSTLHSFPVTDSDTDDLMS